MSAPREVWLCVSGEDYEGSDVDAVYADVHGARAWLRRVRRTAIGRARRAERELAEAEERKPDYSNLWFPLLADDATEWHLGAAWWRIAPWKVLP